MPRIVALLPTRSFLALLAALSSGPALAESAPALLVAEGFTAPAAVTASDALSRDVASERSWTQENRGITLRLIEVRLRKPCTLAHYLARWRRSHACTAKPVKHLGTSIVAPQSTLAGTCEGGDRYIMHVVKLADGFVELHADSSILGPGASELEQALRGLLLTTRRRSPEPEAKPAPKVGAQSTSQ